MVCHRGPSTVCSRIKSSQNGGCDLDVLTTWHERVWNLGRFRGDGSRLRLWRRTVNWLRQFGDACSLAVQWFFPPPVMHPTRVAPRDVCKKIKLLDAHAPTVVRQRFIGCAACGQAWSTYNFCVRAVVICNPSAPCFESCKTRTR